MTRRWPNTLPLVSAPGYGLTPKDQTRRTDMEAGAQRVRRITRTRLDRITMQWIMEDAQLWAFRRWFADDLVSMIGASDEITGWTRTNATRQASWSVGPDLVPLDKLVETAATGQHCMTKTMPGAASNGIDVAICAMLKGFGRSIARLTFVNRLGVECYATVDLSSGALLNSTALVSAKVTNRGNGWWRVEMVANTATGSDTPFLRIGIADGTGAFSYAGDTAKGIGVGELQARFSGLSNLFIPADSDGYAMGADGGAAWFGMDVAVGGGLTRAEGRFTGGPPQANAAGGLQWTLSGQMEVRNA